ncbi:MAG: hypothetical protein EP305_04750 [Bacteroidetes bacterium]|nr:MAG: hypothetical protein EP305_04750 [Bacteroidota bacterium]
MIYFILKQLIKYSIRAFFRQFVILGKKNIPKNSPAIYVANHPSALIDPLVVGVSIDAKIYFLAGENWFGKGFRSYLFKEHFNMIPVHRPWLSNGKPASNVEMFRECYKSLSQGKSILLFPEASSETVSRIRELKTGAIRIKEGFEEYMEQKATVPIIPVGINYSNPHEFQSRVVVKFGAPIDFSGDYSGMAPTDILRSKAEKMQKEMESQIINISNDANQDLVRYINRLFINVFKVEEGISSKDEEALFSYAQGVANAIEYYEKKDQDSFVKMSSRIKAYFDHLKSIGATDDQINRSSRIRFSIYRILLLSIGAPLALLSLIFFYVPYELSKKIYVKKLKPMIDKGKTFDDAFTASMIFAAGLVIFMIWNLLLFLGLGLITGKWLLALGSMLLGYPLFRFGLYYSKHVIFQMQYLKAKRLKKVHPLEYEQLSLEREDIIDELKEFREGYIRSTEK